MEIPFSSSVLCSSVCSVFGSASGASPHGAREEGQKARILEARRRLDARVRVEPRRTRSCGGPCVFGRESAREAVRGAVDDDPFDESPLEKPLEPAGRLGERDGVLGESGREMEGLSRKQDTKSFASVTSPWIWRGVKAPAAAGEAMARRTSVSSVSTTAVTGIVRPRAFVRSLISFERTASPSGVTALGERFASTTPAAEKPSSAALVASSARVMPQTFISPKTSLLTASETSSA